MGPHFEGYYKCTSLLQMCKCVTNLCKFITNGSEILSLLQMCKFITNVQLYYKCAFYMQQDKFQFGSDFKRNMQDTINIYQLNV